MVDFELIGVARGDRDVVSFFVDLEIIVRPEGIIIVERFGLTLGVEDGGDSVLHFDAKTGTELLFSFVEGTHTDAYFHTHWRYKAR